jgi:type II secretion system protein G
VAVLAGVALLVGAGVVLLRSTVDAQFESHALGTVTRWLTLCGASEFDTKYLEKAIAMLHPDAERLAGKKAADLVREMGRFYNEGDTLSGDSPRRDPKYGKIGVAKASNGSREVTIGVIGQGQDARIVVLTPIPLPEPQGGDTGTDMVMWEARRTRAQSDLHELDQALEVFKVHVGRYPTTEEGLQALLTAPAGLDNPDAWRGPYLARRRTVPPDPWGHEYVYRCPGEKYPGRFDLCSLGADGTPGGQGADADVYLSEE